MWIMAYDFNASINLIQQVEHEPNHPIPSHADLINSATHKSIRLTRLWLYKFGGCSSPFLFLSRFAHHVIFQSVLLMCPSCLQKDEEKEQEEKNDCESLHVLYFLPFSKDLCSSYILYKNENVIPKIFKIGPKIFVQRWFNAAVGFFLYSLNFRIKLKLKLFMNTKGSSWEMLEWNSIVCYRFIFHTFVFC